MKNSNRIISLILALFIMMGTVMIPSPSYAYDNENNDRFVEAEYHITEENGKLYKEYNYDDIKPKIKTGFNLFMVGDPLPYSINVIWTTFDLIPSDVGVDIKFSIYDTASRKIIAETDKIVESTNDFETKYVFKETAAYSDSGVSHDTSTWRMRVPNEFRFDVRVKNADSGFSATSGMQALVAQYATPIYKAEYFTNKNTPALEVYKRDTDDIVKKIKINPTNLGENEYYSFGTDENGTRFYYAGKQINISHFEMQDNLVKLEISEPVVANRVQLYAKGAGVTDYNRQGSFTDTANDNTPYHYLVTGNYKTPHIVTVRQDLKVNFDPNGGQWNNADTDQEKEVKSFIIGHSMKIGESWGDIEAISVPTADEIKPPVINGRNNDFLGWNTDSEAKVALTNEEIENITITEDTTLYAIYSEQAPGTAKVEYLDNFGNPIDTKFQLEGVNYPDAIEGNIGDAIQKDAVTAPNFVGYRYINTVLNPENGTYTQEGNNKVQLYYEKIKDVIPSKEVKEKPAGYVTVEFLPGQNGTLEGETKYYVNPIAGKTNADITQPTINANTGFTVTNAKWDPSFDSDTKITKNATYTAQYTASEDIIPGTDPETNQPNERPAGYVMVEFLPGQNGTLEGETKYYVNPEAGKKNSDLTEPMIKAKPGFKAADRKWDPAFSNNAEITTDATYTAQYKSKVVIEDPKDGDYVKVNFSAETNGTFAVDATTEYWVLRGETVNLTAPTATGNTGYAFNGWNPEVKDIYDTDITHKAQYTYNGKDVVSQGPGEDKPQVPDNFVKVEFKPGSYGSIANTETVIYWVNPEKEVTVEAPMITAKEAYKHVGWDQELTQAFKNDTDINATYKAKVVTADPQDAENYVKVNFSAETKGSFEDNQTTEYWVLKGETVSLKAPTVKPNESYVFTNWDPKVATSYTENTTHKAQYAYNGENVIPVQDLNNPPEKPEGFVTVNFAKGDHGEFAQDAVTQYYVKKDTLVSLTAPTVTAEDDYKHTGWDHELVGKFTNDPTTITAQYEEITAPEPEQFTIRYLSMDTAMGTVTTDSETLTEGATPNGSTAKPAEGYEFVRWMDVENPTDTSLTYETIKPTEAKNSTYIAIFKATEPEPTNEFTIWYVPADSTMGRVSLDKETITEGQTIEGSTAFSNDETKYQFIKWIDESGNEVSTDATLTPNVKGSTVFVAVFDEIEKEPVKHTISFNANGGEGTMTSIEVLEGDYTLPVSNFTREDYNFVGWKVDGQEDVLTAGETIQVTEDTTLVAQWEKIPVTPEPTTYTVSYKSGSQNATGTMAKDTVKENEKYTVLKNKFEYEGHEFSGWLIEETKTYVQPGDSIDIHGDITLVAQWKEMTVTPDPEPTEKVTINYKFKSDNGTKLPKRVNNLLPKNDYVEEGSVVKAPVRFSNVRVYDNGGYWTFIQWAPEKFENVKLDGNYTFVGTWTWNEEESTPNTKPEQKPDPKPDKPGGNFIPGWTGEEKPDVKETGRHIAYIKGYPDDTIRPDRQITRAEAATLIARLEGLDMSNNNRPSFTDVESNWYNSAINVVTKKGLMQGYPDGNFKPNAPITRTEFAQLIKNINKKSYVNKGLPFEDVKGHWGYDAIDKAYRTGLITGYPDGTFKPDREITRGEVARIANNLYDRGVDESGLVIVANKTEQFKDLHRSHWAYFDLIEASNTHYYVRREAGKVMENWTKINK